jgi:hypothetical protein
MNTTNNRLRPLMSFFLIIGILGLAACGGVQDPVAGPDDGQKQDTQENMAHQDGNLAGAAGSEDDSAHVDFMVEESSAPLSFTVSVATILILGIIGLGVWLLRRNSTA